MAFSDLANAINYGKLFASKDHSYIPEYVTSKYRGKDIFLLLVFLRNVKIEDRYLLSYHFPSWYSEYKIFLDFTINYDNIANFIKGKHCLLEFETQKDEFEHVIKSWLCSRFRYNGDMSGSVVDLLVNIALKMPEKRAALEILMGDYIIGNVLDHKFADYNSRSVDNYNCMKSPIYLEYKHKLFLAADEPYGFVFSDINSENIEEYIGYLRNCHTFYSAAEKVYPNFRTFDSYKMRTMVAACLELINQMNISRTYGEINVSPDLVKELAENPIFKLLLENKLEIRIVK